MAKVKAALIATALVAGGATAWSLSSGDDEATGTRQLVNQVWIEGMPQNKQQMIGHLALLDDGKHQFGGVGRSSQWRHFVEIFGWRLEGNELRMFFPQEQVRAKAKARTWRCEGEAPAPFELCLELTVRDGQKINFYSMKEWVIRPHQSLEDLAAEHPELEAVFANTEIATAPEIDLDADYAAGAFPW